MHRILLSLGLLTAMGTATWAQGPHTCRIPCRLLAPRAVSETPPLPVSTDAIDHSEVYNGPANPNQQPVQHRQHLTCGLQVLTENLELTDGEMAEATPPGAGQPVEPMPNVLTYNFEAGTLEEIAGIGPVMRQLANTNGASSDFQTLHGRCGDMYTHLVFSQNAGLSFDNGSGFLADEYSIEIKFRFDETESWRRVIDFNNQGQDMGIYLKNGLLEYYGPATGQYANMPEVQPGQWVHALFIRRQAKEGFWVMEMFANGRHVLTTPAPQESHLDASGQVVFFQDDQQVMNEASAGNVQFIRLYNYALNAQQVPEALAQAPLRPEDITTYECGTEGYDIGGEATEGTETTEYDKPMRNDEPIDQGDLGGCGFGYEPEPEPVVMEPEPVVNQLEVLTCQCMPLEFIAEETPEPIAEPAPEPQVDALPGTGPAETDATWVFYPNPATEGIWVRGLTANAPVQATLRDAAGRTVPGLAVAAPSGNTVYIAWPAGIASGQYFLTVFQGTNALTQRVVVQ